MHFNLLNVVSALSIGLVIFGMATIRNVHLKATLYTLPIPISIALFATHGVVGASNIFGLFLVCGFIWSTYVLFDKFGRPILVADIVSALLYIVLGYALIRFVHLSFLRACCLFVLAWSIVLFYLARHPHTVREPKPQLGNPVVKGIGVTLMSYILFTLKSYLSGIVVTFPYSGVFAVVETKNHLETLGRILSRNSLAILGLFITVYVLPATLTLATKIAIGWLFYFAILLPLQKIKV